MHLHLSSSVTFLLPSFEGGQILLLPIFICVNSSNINLMELILCRTQRCCLVRLKTNCLIDCNLWNFFKYIIEILSSFLTGDTLWTSWNSPIKWCHPTISNAYKESCYTQASGNPSCNKMLLQENRVSI